MTCCFPRLSASQAPPDPVAKAPVHFGPFGLAPKFAISNVGKDNNVFNESTNPKDDFTLTTSPGLDLWLRTGKGMFKAAGRVDLTYYTTYANQSSSSSGVTGNYEYPINRLRPFLAFSTLNAKERPGYEINTRVRRYEDGQTAGLDFRVASKSYIGFDYQHQSTRYADDAVYAWQELDQTLNRETNSVNGSFKQSLTPLTTFMITTSYEEERFEFQTDRNSNSLRVMAGFDLSQFALIRGSARVGFRSKVAADGGNLPAFRGLIANVDTSYTAPSQTRLTARFRRDVQPSYDPKNPYYVQTGFGLVVTQRVIGKWDVQAGAARDLLGYQTQLGDGRDDRIDHISGGIGYQLADQVRVSFDVQGLQRLSQIENDYRSLRWGFSVNYGY